MIYSILSRVQRKPLPGTRVKIVWLPSARNTPGVRNAYIGMEGVVVYDGDSISIFTGTSWLVIGDGNFVWKRADARLDHLDTGVDSSEKCQCMEEILAGSPRTKFCYVACRAQRNYK